MAASTATTDLSVTGRRSRGPVRAGRTGGDSPEIGWPRCWPSTSAGPRWPRRGRRRRVHRRRGPRGHAGHRRRRGRLRRAGRAGGPGAVETRRRPRVCGVGCGGPMLPGGETVSPLNIRAWSELPAAGSPGRPRPGCRSPSTTTPRRWHSARAGSGRPGARQLSGHGGVDRHRGRHRARRPAARRGRWECRAHRPRGGRARRAARACAGAGLSGGRGVRIVDRGDDRPAAVGGSGRGAPSCRNAGRPGGGLGGQPVGPRAGRGGRLGGPRVRRTVLRRRPGGDRADGPGSTSRGRPGSSRPGWAPTGRWWGRRPWVAGHWPRRRAGRDAGGDADPARTGRSSRQHAGAGPGGAARARTSGGPLGAVRGWPRPVGGVAAAPSPSRPSDCGRSGWSPPTGARTPSRSRPT